MEVVEEEFAMLIRIGKIVSPVGLVPEVPGTALTVDTEISCSLEEIVEYYKGRFVNILLGHCH